MLARSIVPKSNRVGPPMEPALIFRRRRLAIEIIKQLPAFIFADTNNVLGKGDIDVDRFSTGVGVAAHHRVFRVWISALVFVYCCFIGTGFP